MQSVFAQQWHVCAMLSVDHLPGLFCSMAISFCGYLNGVTLDLSSFIPACCILFDQLRGRDLGV